MPAKALKAKTKTKKVTDHKLVEHPPYAVILKHVRSVKKTNARMIALTRSIDVMKSGYFDVKDQKTDPQPLLMEMELLKKEVAMAKEAILSSLGNKPIRMRLSTNIVLTATVTSGVVNTVIIGGSNSSLDPSLCTEWSSVTALFDAYKCHGGEVVIAYVNPIPAGTAAVATADSQPVIGYDPDTTTGANTLAMTQLAQHKMLEPLVQYSTVAIAAPASGPVHRFRWRNSSLQIVGNIAASDSWNLTSAPVSAGRILFYHVGNTVTAINVGTGVVYFDLEFRSRA
jgi:hypothetical protein